MQGPEGLPYFLRYGSHQDLGLTNESRLADQGAPEVVLPCPQSTGITGTVLTHPANPLLFYASAGDPTQITFV